MIQRSLRPVHGTQGVSAANVNKENVDPNVKNEVTHFSGDTTEHSVNMNNGNDGFDSIENDSTHLIGSNDAVNNEQNLSMESNEQPKKTNDGSAQYNENIDANDKQTTQAVANIENGAFATGKNEPVCFYMFFFSFNIL